jgi:hypothetical protein
MKRQNSRYSEPDDDIDDFRELLMEWVGGEEDIFTFPDTVRRFLGTRKGALTSKNGSNI